MMTSGKNGDAGGLLVQVAERLALDPNPFDTGDAGRAPKILAAASLPYRKPAPEKLVNGNWVRQNGDYSLVVQGGVLGIPYGMYPRLLLFWICGEVHRTGDRRLTTGRSFSDFCRQLKIDNSRGKRGPGRAMIEQSEKLLDARISYTARRVEKNIGRSRADHLNIADSRDLFWDASRPNQATLFESTILLTEEFFRELTENFIPIDMRAVEVIRKRESPLELDILLWLSYRLYNQGARTSLVTWDQICNQFGSGFARPRDFRNQAFLPALKAITTLYPHVNVKVDEKGVILGPGAPLIPRKLHAVGP